MFKDRSVAVVVTAFNEEKLILDVLDSMPEWVDHVLVVNDGSTDRTVDKVTEFMQKEPKVALINHPKNKGVGGAIASGYKYCLEKNYDITVVMNGDAQMDPEDLSALITPLANGVAHYSKGNRLFHGKAWELIPHYRYIGNSILSLLTKIASGYWHVADSQCGYTAISKVALEAIKIDEIFPRYGVPNDILVKLNIESMVVTDVPIRPIYNIGEVSGIKLANVIPDISFLLLRRFFERLTQKYVIRDFHPLIFFYILGLIALPLGSGMGFYYFCYRILIGHVTPVTALFAAFLTLTGLLFLLFAMLFDMEYNKGLKG
ncbi:MAG: glycosyltransferase family 2 protein [Nitrospinales bacterium]